jgi:hypothetical protein
METDPFRLLSCLLEIGWVTFMGMNVPVLSVMGVECLGIVCSPLAKWNPKFSLINIRKISLPLVVFSPEWTLFRPWTSIFGESPWISHLNEFMSTSSLSIFKAKTFKDAVSMTSNKVVMTDLASGCHWILSIGTFQNNVPEIVISHLVRHV